MAGKTIDVDAVIAEASSVIKNVSEQEKQLMIQWCYTAARKIGSGPQDVRVSEKLFLNDFSAQKPSDLSSVIDLALFDSADQEIVIKFQGSSEGPDLGDTARIHQDVRSGKQALQVSEDGTYFNVESFSDDSPGDAYFKTRYYAYPVDDDGMPRIYEECTLAIMMYIRYMWTLRERRSLGEIQEARQTWLSERASAESEIKTPSMLEGREIALGLNSMIHNPDKKSRRY